MLQCSDFGQKHLKLRKMLCIVTHELYETNSVLTKNMHVSTVNSYTQDPRETYLHSCRTNHGLITAAGKSGLSAREVDRRSGHSADI